MTALRYRSAKDTADRLGQVFTPLPIARLLSDNIPKHPPCVHHIVDLGSGKGALALTLLDQFQNASASLIEIDRSFVSHLRSFESEQVHVLGADVLDPSWATQADASIIVSNPPYGSTQLNDDVRKLLNCCGLDIPLSGNWIRGDIAFIAKAWSLAQPSCHLGIIVAAPLVRDHQYASLRQRLLSQLKTPIVTSLSELTFPNKEVRTFIITGQRSVTRNRKIVLRKASIDGEILDEVTIRHSAAEVSLDIDYHRTLERLGLQAEKANRTLGTLGASISRGSRSQSQFRSLGLKAFHTTDFPIDGEDVLLHGAYPGYRTATAGDILIPRVGSRCLDRQTRVRDGQGLITDCVYLLRVSDQNRDIVWKTLTSNFGIEWRLASAAGSCAKYLTKGALTNMPIIL